MSRSYRKVHLNSYRTEEGSSFKRSKHYRVQCRRCICREKTNPEYGEVVFPSYKSFPKTARYTYHNHKNEIRQRYYRVIQETLNRYTIHNRHTVYRRDPRTDEIYVEIINRIKGLAPNIDIGREWHFQWLITYYFEWLNLKKVKRIVKAWGGDPFDLPKYLTDKGYVEKAVRLEFKLSMAK